MRIAVQQHAGTPGDVAANLRTLQDCARAAAGFGIDLMVFPELFLSGYWIGEQAAALALRADGPECAEVAATASEHGIALCVGYPRQGNSGVHNAALLVDGEGRTLGHYDKRRGVGEFERSVFADGDADLVVEIRGVRTGVLICYDSEFPENVRRLAHRGVELLLVPTALSLEYAVVAEVVIPTRAFENGLYVAYADRWGSENGKRYAGSSCLCAPDGEVLARAGVNGDALLVADVDRGAVIRARNALPYLEDSLTLPAFEPGSP